MTVGLFFGTFNPIHHGHVQVAQSAMFDDVIDKIWFMVTPQSPLKKNMALTSPEHRLEMVRLALGEYDNFQASDFEFSLSHPQYTVDTLRLIQKRYADNNFILIMGSDNYTSLCHLKWKDSEYILENFQIYVYGRTNDFDAGYNYIKIPGDFLPVSSSDIRSKFQVQKTELDKVPDFENILNKEVFKYIKCHQLYTI